MHGDICHLVMMADCESAKASAILVYHPISHSRIVLQHESVLCVGCQARVSLPCDLVYVV